MKPQHTIALVVVAVLATVAIEETRISKMRAEIIRLQAIPRNDPSDIEAIVNEAEEKPPKVIEKDIPDPVEAPETSPETSPETEKEDPPPSGRVIFEDFPEPDDATVKRLALSPYSDFCYEIDLNNRERAYLHDLLDRRSNLLRETAAKWMTAPPSQRPSFEDMMTLIIAKSDDSIATFLNNEADSKAFADYHAMQPEREQVAAMASGLDEAGATLDMAKEKKLVEALYQARVGTGSLDWNSPAGLKATADGAALERFNKEWDTRTQALTELLPKFLSETESAAVLKSRETLKPDMVASIESAIESINRGSE